MMKRNIIEKEIQEYEDKIKMWQNSAQFWAEQMHPMSEQVISDIQRMKKAIQILKWLQLHRWEAAETQLPAYFYKIPEDRKGQPVLTPHLLEWDLAGDVLALWPYCTHYTTKPWVAHPAIKVNLAYIGYIWVKAKHIPISLLSRRVKNDPIYS